MQNKLSDSVRPNECSTKSNVYSIPFDSINYFSAIHSLTNNLEHFKSSSCSDTLTESYLSYRTDISETNGKSCETQPKHFLGRFSVFFSVLLYLDFLLFRHFVTTFVTFLPLNKYCFFFIINLIVNLLSLRSGHPLFLAVDRLHQLYRVHGIIYSVFWNYNVLIDRLSYFCRISRLLVCTD